MKKTAYNISIGSLLSKHIQKKQLVNAELGKAIQRCGTSITKYMNSDSMQTSVLIEFCYALKHNFFRDIADQLPSDFSKSKSDDLSALNEKELLLSQKESQIHQLQEEIKVLKIKNELLMKIQGI
ncbi:hypothetical protein OX284_001150 [Flavobacterium sp. SUN046]|uniref:hypothetical protein n=1 Tax=Flavobacterium sp. SUN046 TaxID=3002440 RepID=UPI002DB58C30|nr:hypothetical protein [Flavobacterium sp. SUN046]MEC4048019.1 hypothetical protein [Flavobacterium sp. SUN046]